MVGVLGKAVGLKGEVELVTGSDEPGLLGPPAIYRLPGGGTLTARSLRRHGDRWVIAFDEVDDRTGAEDLRGTELVVPAEARRALPPDEWWPEDLVGLAAVDTAGRPLGEVVDVVVGGPQDRLVVGTDEGPRDVPFVPTIVVEVDTDRGRIVLDPPAGLL